MNCVCVCMYVCMAEWWHIAMWSGGADELWPVDEHSLGPQTRQSHAQPESQTVTDSHVCMYVCVCMNIDEFTYANKI